MVKRINPVSWFCPDEIPDRLIRGTKFVRRMFRPPGLCQVERIFICAVLIVSSIAPSAEIAGGYCTRRNRAAIPVKI